MGKVRRTPEHLSMPLKSSDPGRGISPRRHIFLSLSRAAFRAVLAVVITAWSLLLLGWLILHWGILPYIDAWRPDIESRASKALGIPVHIGRIQVLPHGWMPALELDTVVLSDPSGRPALQLPKVIAGLSARSFWTFSIRLSQLDLEGAQLEVRRDRAGRIWVAGLDTGGSAVEQGHQGANWFWSQPEVLIRGGRLRWVDELRAAPPLELQSVDLVLRNGFRHHEMRLDATPPAAWGTRFNVRGRFTQPVLAQASDWTQWSGTAHVELPHADLDALHHYVKLPFDLQAGQGALRAWVDLTRGQWRSATLDLNLDQVRMRLARKLDVLQLSRIQGRLQADRQKDGVQLAAQRLSFVTDDGRVWTPSQIGLRWSQQQDMQTPMAAASVPEAPVTGGALSADRLDLAMMAYVAERLPLPDEVRKALLQTHPMGVVSGLKAQWQGALDEPAAYRIQAHMSGLSIAPGDSTDPKDPGRPGWQNADLDLDANETGGQGQLLIRNGSVSFPGVLAEARVPIDRLKAKLIWQVRPRAGHLPALDVLVQDADIVNADLRAQVSAHWRTGEGDGTGSGKRFPGVLDLTAQIPQMQAVQVARYLPLGVGDDARWYVSHAIRGGVARQLKIRVNGDLWDVPFADQHPGVFQVSTKLQDVTLAYVPGDKGAPSAWPEFTQLQGELVFDRASMFLRHVQAKVWGLTLQDVNGEIADLMQNSVLSIGGHVVGPMEDALRFVAHSPVEQMVGGSLHDASSTGSTDLRLALKIPLDDTDKTQVVGDLQLRDNTLRLSPSLPVFARTAAKIHFTEKDFALSDGVTQLLGGEAKVSGALQPDGSLRFDAQGTATAQGMQQAAELGGLPVLASRLKGQAAYALQVSVLRGQTEFKLDSSLVGLASDLPAPLNKLAGAELPLHIQSRLNEASLRTAHPQDTLDVTLGNVVKAQYQRDLSGAAAQILRGGIGINAPFSVPPSGVRAVLHLDEVDADAWQALGSQIQQSEVNHSLAHNTTSIQRSPYEPTQVSLVARTLSLDSRKLQNLRAELECVSTQQGEQWKLDLLADQVEGHIDYEGAKPGGDAGRIVARFRRLVLPKADEDDVDKLVDQAGNAVPELDVVVDDFEVEGHKLGKLEMEARYRGNDGREWTLSKLTMTGPDAKLTGTGVWTPGPRRRMAIKFRMDIQDSGKVLEKLGMGKLVRGGKGHLSGELAWLGSPLSPDWTAMTGQMQISLDGGQFLKVNPGAARLMSVLSLQSLPRRFLLDFRDVFDAGFAFDNVSGDVDLNDGIASTRNLRIRGVQAVVLMEGQTDLRRETQDLHVVVVPEVNAGTASLAYAAINPVVGLGTFLAQWLMRKPLMEASTKEFQITGGWSSPQVVSVPHKSFFRPGAGAGDGAGDGAGVAPKSGSGSGSSEERSEDSADKESAAAAGEAAISLPSTTGVTASHSAAASGAMLRP